MRALLMHEDRDFDPESAERPESRPEALDLEESYASWRQRREREANEPPFTPHQLALIQDLELTTLLQAMSASDEFLFKVARAALLLAGSNDVETILYRQQILKDCLAYPVVVRELYTLAVETLERRRKYYIGALSRFPSSVLYESLDAMHMLLGMLGKLREVADVHADAFTSRGFRALFSMLRHEFTDEYLTEIRNHLVALKFSRGMLVSAQLGAGNAGTNYVLRRSHAPEANWFERLIGQGSPGYTFHIHERDEAGAKILSDLQNRGINDVANALAQSKDHILSFFEMLRTELAFYVACLNLHERLGALLAPTCFATPHPVGTRRHRGCGLYDVSLVLNTGQAAVGNVLDADGQSLIIITGANQGGKSTFLRAVGQAQLMMQCGMFVAAESYEAEVCQGVFTHYKREEDATMKHGKLDEELARMSAIVDVVLANSLVLFNESFASTNEREGSEIARQIVAALMDKGIKVAFVTHLYEFATSMLERRENETAFLRAERQADGTRTFKVVPAPPLQTSFGEDLYRQVFGSAEGEASDSESTRERMSSTRRSRAG